MKTFYSKGAKPQDDPEAEILHGPPNDLERFFNSSDTEKLYCLTDEREAFESNNGVSLDSDVLLDDLFCKLKEHCL